MFSQSCVIQLTGKGGLPSEEGSPSCGGGGDFCMETPPRYGQPAVGTHPTGMQSSVECYFPCFTETTNGLQRGLDSDDSMWISGSVDVTVDADNCDSYSHVLIVVKPTVGVPHVDSNIQNDFIALPLNVMCSGKYLLRTVKISSKSVESICHEQSTLVGL